MEEEKSKCQKCYNCGFYTPYYLKGYIKFNKTEEGWCRAKAAQVNRHGSCERHISVYYRRKNYSKSHTYKTLLMILSQLSEIRQIIEEAEKDE